MADEVRCFGCNGSIDNPDSPEVIRATRSMRPPTLAGKMKAADEGAAYFHVRCFSGQQDYQPV